MKTYKSDYMLNIIENIYGIKLKPYQKMWLKLIYKYKILTLKNKRKMFK